MKFYFSGGLGRDIDEYFFNLNARRLFSVAYENELFSNLKMLQFMGIEGYDIIIDSGAFTAWNTGKPMEMSRLEYVWDKILKEHPQHNYTFMALDVIPGGRGRERSQEDFDYAEKHSINNYHYLVGKYPNLNIIPIYHAPEPLRVLEHYLENTDHIAISVNAALSEKERVLTLQQVFPHHVKVHGLATTGLKMLRCVEWYSVDSATWVMIGAMGGLLWLNDDETGFIKIPVSIESPRRKIMGSHIDNNHAADIIYEKITQYGFDVELLRYDYKQRARWNILMWHKLKVSKTEGLQQGLFKL